MTEYAMVIDSQGKKLSPTPVGNAWYLVRKQRATLVQKYPMVVQLKREIPNEDIDPSTFRLGIDDGSKYVGIAIVQECQTKNKVVFKGIIEQRKDVSKLMTVRKEYRKYRRKNKRYRPARFNNRASSRREDRLAPTISQKKNAILRTINQLYIPIHAIYLEDVLIDIRALQEGKKLNGMQYQKSNRLDENLRIATLMRDDYTCMECQETKGMLHAHHIVPKRLNGADTISNLITLCEKCHAKIDGIEEQFITKYQKLINGKSIRFDYAMHVMQGKKYLKQELAKIAPLRLAIGGDTANKRIEWDIPKTHSNDAIVITDLKPTDIDVKEWLIKPRRRQSKVEQESKSEYKHGDYVKYTNKKKEVSGRITSMLKSNGYCKIITSQGKSFGPISPKSLKLIWRFNKVYFLDRDESVVETM